MADVPKTAECRISLKPVGWQPSLYPRWISVTVYEQIPPPDIHGLKTIRFSEWLEFGLLSGQCGADWPNENPRKLAPRADFGYINQWIDMCTKHHGDACNNPNRDFQEWVNMRDRSTGQPLIDMCSADAKSLNLIRRSLVEQYFDGLVTSVDSNDGSMPLKLVDTFTRRIIFAEEPVAYVALSYVWGNVQRVYVNKDDFSSESNEPPSAPLPLHLPKTFEDALVLTKNLHLRYLWIDALCISQNDGIEKDREINRMDKIYSQAFITVIAADGPDANYGLPRVTKDATSSAQVCETINGRGYATNMPSSHDLHRKWPWNRSCVDLPRSRSLTTMSLRYRSRNIVRMLRLVLPRVYGRINR